MTILDLKGIYLAMLMQVPLENRSSHLPAISSHLHNHIITTSIITLIWGSTTAASPSFPSLTLIPTSRDPAERLVLALVLPRLRGRVLVLSAVVPPVRICLTDGLCPGFRWSECPWVCTCPPWECTRPLWGIMWPCPWGIVLIVP